MSQQYSNADLGSGSAELAEQTPGGGASASTNVSGLTPYATYTVAVAKTAGDDIGIGVSGTYILGPNTSGGCQSAYNNLINEQWGGRVQTFCTFKAPSDGNVTITVALSKPPFAVLLNTPAGSASFDTVTLFAGGDTTGAYQNAAFSFNGVVTSPLLVRTFQNTTTALQVQNSAGVDVFRTNTQNGGIYAHSYGNNNALTAIQNGSCEGDLSLLSFTRCAGVFGQGNIAGVVGLGNANAGSFGVGGLFAGSAGYVLAGGGLGAGSAALTVASASSATPIASFGSGAGAAPVVIAGDGAVKMGNGQLTGSTIALTVDGTGSMADVAVFNDNGSPVLTVQDGGNVVVANSLDVGPQAVAGSSQCWGLFGATPCEATIEVGKTFTSPTAAVYGIQNWTNIDQQMGVNANANSAQSSWLFLNGTQNYTSENAATYSVAAADTSNGVVIDALYGIATSVLVNQGTVTKASGLYVAGVAGGDITNNYGIIVDAQNATGNNYGISVGTATTQTLWLASDADNTTANAGIAFGLSRDTNLYRAAAATLKTDGQFEVANAVGIGTSVGLYAVNAQSNSAGGYVANFTNTGDNQDRYGIRIQAGANDASGTTYYLDAYDGDGTQVGYIANVAGTFGVTDVSDSRTKTNITDTQVDAASILGALRVVDFNRLQNPAGSRITGFIAQEVQALFPNAVTTGSDGYLGVVKDSFIPLLVKGYQVQQGQMNNMQTQVNAQLVQLASLQTAITATSVYAQPAPTFTHLTVTQAATIADLQVSTLEVTNTLTVLGDARFDANVAVKGTFTLAGALVGNPNTRGTITIPAGTTEARYDFTSSYTSVPNVVASPTNTFAPAYRIEAANDHLTIKLKDAATENIMFNFQVQQ